MLPQDSLKKEEEEEENDGEQYYSRTSIYGNLVAVLQMRYMLCPTHHGCFPQARPNRETEIGAKKREISSVLSLSLSLFHTR